MENDGSMQWRLGASSGNETRRRKEENNRLIELLFSAAAAAAATLRWRAFAPKPVALRDMNRPATGVENSS